MKLTLCALLTLATASTFAQTPTPQPEPRIVVVPMENATDAGVAAPAQAMPPEPLPPPEPAPQLKSPSVPEAPPAEPLPTRTIEAMPPVVPNNEVAETPNLTPTGPGAMLDGQKREGAFLSGPGSLTFVLHHTLMTGFGLLSTQLIPRAIRAADMGNSDIVSGRDARIAYLASTLLGAGAGFGFSAWWQFNHWISPNTANFGIINSFFGGAFLGGLTDLLSRDPTAVTWMTVLGNTAGAWLSTIVGGGQLALNRGVFITSGGLWAGIYTALILGIVASTGGAAALRNGLDALLLTPAIGAGAIALAGLKFNPSTAQVMRANIFGVGVGAAVLLLSGLLVSFNSPVPYVLSGIGAIGAKAIVSVLWAEAASDGSSFLSAVPSGNSRRVWW
jgi:hypothetical protein